MGNVTIILIMTINCSNIVYHYQADSFKNGLAVWNIIALGFMGIKGLFTFNHFWSES